MTNLNHHPKWLYLLRVRYAEPDTKDERRANLETEPALDQPGRALELASAGLLSGVARTNVHLANELIWEWGYEGLGRDLGDRYAYYEFTGPRGPIATRS